MVNSTEGSMSKSCNYCGYPINPGAANHPDCMQKRIAELEACIRGLVDHGFPEHSAVRRRELEKGIGSATDGGRAWIAAFAAIGKPVKIKINRS